MKRLHSLDLHQIVESSQAEIANARKELDELHSKEFSEVHDRLHK
jgi:hypothetical protein